MSDEINLCQNIEPGYFSIQMQIDGAMREVCRFQIVDGALDIKVPPDLPMTRAARCFLSAMRENFGL
jgi:hypothetical protein